MELFVRPETVRLTILGSHWIDVNRYLTQGQFTKAITATAGEVSPSGWHRPNMEMAGLSMVMAYLVDWSFRDGNDKPVAIDTDAKKQAALWSLHSFVYRAVQDAINQHVEQMALELEEKKRMSGIVPHSDSSS